MSENDNEVGQFVDWVVGDMLEGGDKCFIEEWFYRKVREWYSFKEMEELITND